jgi:kumamolisin
VKRNRPRTEKNYRSKSDTSVSGNTSEIPQPQSLAEPKKEQAMPTHDTVPLRGSTRAVVSGSRIVGDPANTDILDITLLLRPKKPIETLNVSALGSVPLAEREHYTREQFASAYGADHAAIELVLKFATEAGLEVVSSDAAQRTVKLRGNVGDLSRIFGVELKLYESPQGPYRGRVGEIQIPEEIASVVQGVFGFDNRRQANSRLVARSPHVAIIRAELASTSFTPIQVGDIYGFPKGLDGTGQCIGIIEFGGGFITDDLKAYFGDLGVASPEVTAFPVDANVPVPPDPSGDTPDGEVMLDIEVAGAIAPKARIVVYFAPFTEQGWVDVLRAAVHDSTNNPSVISISWGWPEGNDLWTDQAVQAVDEALQEAGALGVTVCCASGDDGSADELTDGQVHVDFPASSPYILACGGTTLLAQGGSIVGEATWNNGPRSQNGGASGGGVSDVFPLPAWQSIANVPPSLRTGNRGRGVPDVAADADPNTGYRIRVRGQNTVAGGTSAVAPLWAGLVALLNQALGRPVGYINPLLYTQIAPLGGIFNDVVVGSNDTTGSYGGYPAGVGWDAATGWGSVNGTQLLRALHQIDSQSSKKPAPIVWKQITGSGVDIAANGSGVVWIVGPDPVGAGPAACVWDGKAWKPFPISASRVAVAPDGTPFVVTSKNEIGHLSANGWQQLPGSAVDIAVAGDGTVWVVGGAAQDGDYGVYVLAGGSWRRMPGAGIRIAASASGGVLLIGSKGDLHAWSGGVWQALPGVGVDGCIAADGSIWMLGGTQTGAGYGVYRSGNGGWNLTNGSGIAIAIGSNGAPWLINASGEISAGA